MSTALDSIPFRERLAARKARLQALRDEARQRYAGGAPALRVAALICELLDKPTALIQSADPGPLVTPVKNASFEKAKRMLGYEAQVPLRDGIERTIAWQRATLA